jgi:hypothetical protein
MLNNIVHSCSFLCWTMLSGCGSFLCVAFSTTALFFYVAQFRNSYSFYDCKLCEVSEPNNINGMSTLDRHGLSVPWVIHCSMGYPN